MNTLMRMVSAVAVLATTLFFSGCSNATARKPRVEAVSEFAVVESSTSQELTPAQMEDLRRAVINYLKGQDMAGNRTYYVKVNFAKVNPDDEPQWAVVRIGFTSAQTYTVLASYPGADDYYPYEFYRPGYRATGVYSGGYAGFTRWGYYDPFDYNYGVFSSPRNYPPDRTKPDDKTDDKPADKPQPPTNRWDNPRRPVPENSRRGAYPPRPTTPTRLKRELPDRNSDNRALSPRGESSERSSNPPPERSYTPPERSYSPSPEPIRSNPTVQSVDDNRLQSQH